MKKYVFLLFFLFIYTTANIYAQKSHTLKGVVYNLKQDGTKEPLPFATVYWLQSGTYMDCDEKGRFLFTSFDKVQNTLVATAIGYTRDTVQLATDATYVEFFLRGINELEKAVVLGKQSGNYLSKLSSMKTEVITAAGLCKMACCNLAESFENSASVTVGYSDAITGARQIRLLGLSGNYTQMLDENRPVMRGLASPFGLTYIPGQWLESIQIAKGPSSVINGLEAITGQINMEHRKPTAENPLFINFMMSNMLRTEFNVASSIQLNDKWSTVALGHISTDPLKHDGNRDGFRDEPTTLQFNLANRWLYYAKSGLQVRFGFRALSDERDGGEMNYKEIGPSSMLHWGSTIRNKGVNAFGKVGVPLNADNSMNIALIVDYNFHKMDSNYGLKLYNGKQNSLFANAIFQYIPNDTHRMSFGIRNQFDNFDEKLMDITLPKDLSRRENQLGFYGEYTYTYGEKFTGVVDLSLDYNNLYGWLFAPRTNLKYSFTDDLVMRFSGGRGFRSPNLIADNLGMLSTGRRIFIDTDLKIEDAWTFGGNATAYLPLGVKKENAYVSFDYFRTDFINQILVDQERDWSKVWLYNLDGKSFTNTFQFDFSVEPIERFTVLTTFRYTDAKVTLEGQGLVERPLTSRFKGVLNLQYATRMNVWTFDFTAQLNGKSRLPNFVGSGNEYSPVYPIFFAQVTRKFRDFDVYVGGENLTNYRQPNPIIAADRPFSSDFNASVIWGPLMGIKVYAGMRFTLWK